MITGLARLARASRDGFWEGLAVMRGLDGRMQIIALVIFAVVAQVVRNWLVLKGIGVDVSWFDAMALLIGAAVLGMLPVGPTLGVATAVVILGANGVAITAAAGAMLDRDRRGRRALLRRLGAGRPDASAGHRARGARLRAKPVSGSRARLPESASARAATPISAAP